MEVKNLEEKLIWTGYSFAVDNNNLMVTTPEGFEFKLSDFVNEYDKYRNLMEEAKNEPTISSSLGWSIDTIYEDLKLFDKVLKDFGVDIDKDMNKLEEELIVRQPKIIDFSVIKEDDMCLFNVKEQEGGSHKIYVQRDEDNKIRLYEEVDDNLVENSDFLINHPYIQKQIKDIFDREVEPEQERLINDDWCL